VLVGPGSLLSLLKSKGWANSLGAFPCFAATDWSMFGVAIQRVTEEGLVSRTNPPVFPVSAACSVGIFHRCRGTPTWVWVHLSRI